MEATELTVTFNAADMFLFPPISSSIPVSEVKAMNTYINLIFSFFSFHRFTRISTLFTHYGVVCVEF